MKHLTFTTSTGHGRKILPPPLWLCSLFSCSSSLLLLSGVSRLCVSDLRDPNGSLSFTNPRLETMVHLKAASTLVPLIMWAEVCTDVSTALHLCSEGIPHPHTGIPLRRAELGRDPHSPHWDPSFVLLVCADRLCGFF